MIQCLETLCALNGVSGDEGQVRSYIRGWAEEHADSVRTDALGNLIVFKRGRKAAENRLMLCAHMGAQHQPVFRRLPAPLEHDEVAQGVGADAVRVLLRPAADIAPHLSLVP